MTEKVYPEALAPLAFLLDDPDVMEIMIDSYDRIYVDKRGEKGFVDVPSPFQSNEALLQMMVDSLGAGYRFDESYPITDMQFLDGSRMHMVSPVIAMTGPSLVIRRVSPPSLSFDDLLNYDCLSPAMLQFLEACIGGRLSTVVSGGTGSGKTTVLNLLTQFIGADERTIVLDVGELRPSEHLQRLIRLETRPPNFEGRGEISMSDLVTAASRMRPDRLVVSELRGDETLPLLQTMGSGHDGTLVSLHAASPQDVVSRLETLVAMANPSLPLVNIRRMIVSAVNLITVQKQLTDGTRKITHISEVVGMQGDMIEIQDIFEFQQTGTVEGKVQGQFVPVGVIPKCLHRLQGEKLHIPVSLFTPVS